MAQNDFFKRYIDAGLEFTAMTQSKAEALVKDLVNAGEVQADQARETVAEFLERSRKSSERLIETVSEEVKEQITNLGLASKADVDRAEQRLLSLFGAGTSAARTSARKASSTAKKTAKKASKKASAAKKSATRKTAAKKAAGTRTAKKATRKAAGKKAAATRTAKKTTRKAAGKKAAATRAKKSTAKRSSAAKKA